MYEILMKYETKNNIKLNIMWTWIFKILNQAYTYRMISLIFKILFLLKCTTENTITSFYLKWYHKFYIYLKYYHIFYLKYYHKSLINIACIA